MEAIAIFLAIVTFVQEAKLVEQNEQIASLEQTVEKHQNDIVDMDQFLYRLSGALASIDANSNDRDRELQQEVDELKRTDDYHGDMLDILMDPAARMVE